MWEGCGRWEGLPGEPQGAARAAAGPERPISWPRAIDDKYSRREEYRGFTQDFKEKDGYKPDVKIEYVDETGRKLTPKEVSGAGGDQVTEMRGPSLPGDTELRRGSLVSPTAGRGAARCQCLGALVSVWWAQLAPSQARFLCPPPPYGLTYAGGRLSGGDIQAVG